MMGWAKIAIILGIIFFQDLQVQVASSKDSNGGWCNTGGSAPICKGNQYPVCLDVFKGSWECEIKCQCAPDVTYVAKCLSPGDPFCSPCTICSGSAYQTSPCDGVNDRTCKPCTTSGCSEEEYVTQECSPKADRVCEKCTVCKAEHYRSGGCTGTLDSICTPCTKCDVDTYTGTNVGNQCTPQQDRVCIPCPPCGDNQYIKQRCEGLLGHQCENCKVCDSDEYIEKACTEISDTICLPCPSGMTAQEGSTSMEDCFCTNLAFYKTSDIEPYCKELTTCGENEYEIQAPTNVRDRECGTCPNGYFCDGVSKTICSSCASGEYVFRACTDVSDTQCKDIEDPVISLNGEAIVTLEFTGNTTWADEEEYASATDVRGQSLNVMRRILSGPGENFVGTTVFEYYAIDTFGNRVSVERNVILQDTTAPLIGKSSPILLDVTTASWPLSALNFEVTEVQQFSTVFQNATTLEHAIEHQLPGKHSFTIKITDASDNFASRHFEAFLLYRDRRTIMVKGDSEVVIEASPKNEYQDEGANLYGVDSLFQTVTRDDSLLRTSGVEDVNLGVVKSYQVTYSDQLDTEMSANPVNRTVIVRDTTPPNIFLRRLFGPVEYNTSFQEPGVFLTDNAYTQEELMQNLRLYVDGEQIESFDTARSVGNHTLEYRVTDPSGNTASVQRRLAIVDTIPPDVTLNNPNENNPNENNPNETFFVEAGLPFKDPGATVVDNYDGLISVDLKGTVAINSFEFGPVPRYVTVLYSGKDSSENQRTVSRVVKVDDTLPPTLTFDDMAIEIGSNMNFSQGVTATDLRDGNVEFSYDAVDLSTIINLPTPLNTSVTYTATDERGNNVTRTRVVNLDDTIPPILTVSDVNMTHEATHPFLDPESHAEDRGQLIPVNRTFEIDGREYSSIHTNWPSGTEVLIRYSATDLSGLSSSVERSFTIVDTTPPILRLFGNETFYVDAARPAVPYVDPGVEAMDSLDGNITDSVVADLYDKSGNSVPAINTSAPLGETYTIIFFVTDQAGNNVSRYRTVITHDVSAPVVVLHPLETLQDALLRINQDSPKSPFISTTATVGEGAIEVVPVAVDGYEGAVAVNITVIERRTRRAVSPITVNYHSTPGTYLIEYTSVDSVGNIARRYQQHTVLEAAPTPAGTEENVSGETVGKSSGDQTLVTIAVVGGLLLSAIFIIFLIVRKRSERENLQRIGDVYQATTEMELNPLNRSNAAAFVHHGDDLATYGCLEPHAYEYNDARVASYEIPMSEDGEALYSDGSRGNMVTMRDGQYEPLEGAHQTYGSHSANPTLAEYEIPVVPSPSSSSSDMYAQGEDLLQHNVSQRNYEYITVTAPEYASYETPSDHDGSTYEVPLANSRTMKKDKTAYLDVNPAAAVCIAPKYQTTLTEAGACGTPQYQTTLTKAGACGTSQYQTTLTEAGSRENHTALTQAKTSSDPERDARDDYVEPPVVLLLQQLPQSGDFNSSEDMSSVYQEPPMSITPRDRTASFA